MSKQVEYRAFVNAGILAKAKLKRFKKVKKTASVDTTEKNEESSSQIQNREGRSKADE